MRSLSLRTVLKCLVAVSLFSAVGCGPAKSVNPFALRKENAQLRSALRQSQDHLAEAQIRADNLDVDNEELHNELALQQEEVRRAQEQARQVQDERKLAQRSRSAAPTDLFEEEKEFGPARGRVAGASNSSKPAAPSVAQAERDTSAASWLPMNDVPGAQVSREGNSVRIRVTDANLFDPGKATLKPGATRVLDQVSAALRRNYPGQIIGIEGHTDSDPIRKSKWKDNHELSLERAKAVYEYLRTKGGLHSEQLYVAGFGSNQPIASNANPSGKAQNRRVEFVVRPASPRASVDSDRL